MHYTKGRDDHRAWGRRSRRAGARGAGWLVCAGLLVSAELAEAQIGPGTGPQPGAGGQNEEKKEGVAEAAPKTPSLLPTTPALPAPKGPREGWKLFELDGYYGMRPVGLKNLTLGSPDLPQFGGSPFPTA